MNSIYFFNLMAIGIVIGVIDSITPHAIPIQESRHHQNKVYQKDNDLWMHAGAANIQRRRSEGQDQDSSQPSSRSLFGSPSAALFKNEEEHHWFTNAQDTLRAKLQETKIEAQAKNIIMFLGDGLSLPTVAAARIYKGQLEGLAGEEGSLYFETFPNVALSKTFCTDAQVADSACSSTAYLCGSKANIATIGVSPRVLLNDCEGQRNPDNQLSSILSWAQAAGKSTGIVTTTRITHASPAGAYAHISNRDFEYDGIIAAMGQDPETCDDIAEQLILNEPGKNINVILGGGRRFFMNDLTIDFESGETGDREDGRDLIGTWQENMTGKRAQYVTGREQLLGVNTDETDYLLGLFAPDHLAYAEAYEANDDPSLNDMTQVAIKILSKNPNGFFLFVEGGKIDHAHHDNWARRALVETLEFDSAIREADLVTNDQDTLIVVTADHSHVMTFNGYPDRGYDILGIGDQIGDDNGLPYTTLSYTNGPGYRTPALNNGVCSRGDISDDPLELNTYKSEATVKIGSETHGGDDVGIFAKGPFAHLYSGVQYQSYIPHVMAYAACIGPGDRYCNE